MFFKQNNYELTKPNFRQVISHHPCRTSRVIEIICKQTFIQRARVSISAGMINPLLLLSVRHLTMQYECNNGVITIQL